ncbi:hypothetical protein O4H66_25325 [Comamonadaceae bacterium G21597-S1]|nr:hypothetical protein [Comamonadaceae bacterium G21597-S1]
MAAHGVGRDAIMAAACLRHRGDVPFPRSGDAVVGIFQGLFERNLLTFNPGWDSRAAKLPAFVDVREIQRRLKAQGITIDNAADEKSSGPASFVVEDPDGNRILFDQHVNGPAVH